MKVRPQCEIVSSPRGRIMTRAEDLQCINIYTGPHRVVIL